MTLPSPAGSVSSPAVTLPNALRTVQERPIIEEYLRRQPELHIYELGDLDPEFWPRTRWWGWDDPLRALCLLYQSPEIPTLLCFTHQEDGRETQLLETLAPRLPARFYSHLSPELGEVVARYRHREDHGRHLKMALRDPSRLESADVEGVIPIGSPDLTELQRFYEAAYPDNWFDPRMLGVAPYFGIREGGRLVAVAGFHVVSPRYRVAALGNITTDPDHRGRGLARRATARLCRELLKSVDIIGLNVAADNAPAIACYRRLGFEVVAEFDEIAFS